MSSITVTARRLEIPLRVKFKQASCERRAGESVWIEVGRGSRVGLGEGCPRSYVTGESIDGALAWIADHRDSIESICTSLDALRSWRDAHREALAAGPSAWCAVETALLDLFGREAGCSVESLLGFDGPQGEYRYTAVIGDGSLEQLTALTGRYLKSGFRDFKLKLNGSLEADRRAVRRFRELAGRDVRLRVDANNLWAGQVDAAIEHVLGLGGGLFAVEEPVAPRAVADLSRFAIETGLPVILDESVARADDVDRTAELPGEWIANVKVSKAGGLLGSLEILERAEHHDWPVIVGAHVGETSVMTRCGLAVARRAGDRLVAHEGGFGTLAIENDPVEPILMFGDGGVLKVSSRTQADPDGWSLGLGLRRAGG